MRNRGSLREPAFTLVEMLVAIAIVSLILVFLSVAFSQASRGVAFFNRELDAASVCRTAFDRIAFDLSSRVSLLNTNIVISTKAPGPGNDTLGLYSAVRTTIDSSRFALVTYKIGTVQSEVSTETIPSLIRSNASIAWDTDPLSNLAGVDETLGSGVFRFETAFLVRDGKITATKPTDETQLCQIIVAIAAIDPSAYQLLSPTQINSLAGRLPDAVDGQTPLSNWKLNSFSDLPLPVRENIRFYERYFYIR